MENSIPIKLITGIFPPKSILKPDPKPALKDSLSSWEYRIGYVRKNENPLFPEEFSFRPSMVFPGISSANNRRAAEKRIIQKNNFFIEFTVIILLYISSVNNKYLSTVLLKKRNV